MLHTSPRTTPLVGALLLFLVGCGHVADGSVLADGSHGVEALGTAPCAPAPVATVGHHDLPAGTLTVQSHSTHDAAPASLQAACTQAAALVLVNWQRTRCADYAVATAEGELVGDARFEVGCATALCPVSQACKVTLEHIPDFTFAQP